MFTPLGTSCRLSHVCEMPVSCFRITDADYTNTKPALEKSYQINLTFFKLGLHKHLIKLNPQNFTAHSLFNGFTFTSKWFHPLERVYFPHCLQNLFLACIVVNDRGTFQQSTTTV